jgi:hypothetical protein
MQTYRHAYIYTNTMVASAAPKHYVTPQTRTHPNTVTPASLALSQPASVRYLLSFEKRREWVFVLPPSHLRLASSHPVITAQLKLHLIIKKKKRPGKWFRFK